MFKNILLVSALCLSSASAMAGESFTCGGTEPFWDLWINDKGITLKEGPGMPTVKVQKVAPKGAIGTLADYVRVYSTTTLDQKTPVTIVIRKDDCSDGMSDDRYRYNVTYISEDTIYQGCCK